VLAVAALALVVSPPARAQTGSMRVSLPSPTAASLGKFGDVPVSLYSGVPDITIPLFTAKGRTLELPIAFKYHASGIRVQEIGGWAGMGWTLEGGGSITRTVRGLVDESANGYYHTGHTFWNPSNWPTPSTAVIDNITNETLDGEPDQFFFSFAGRSGQFVMGPTSTSPSIKEYRSIPYQKLSIQPTLAGNHITAWTITTEDGTRYTFAAAETNTDYNLTQPAGEIPAHYGESYRSAWHLTEIRSPGGDVITLSYASYTARHRLASYQERFDQRVGSCGVSQFDVTNEYEISARRLASITTAAHTITFTPGATFRSDAKSPSGAQQEPRLDRITVATPTGTVLRVFQLEHDYSLGGRLTLKNVYEQDRTGVSLPPYSFTYETSPTLPALTSYALDHWGYFNGKTGNSTYIPAGITPSGAALSGADRSPDPAFMRAGVLTRITYPTGGYNEFVYEANDYGAVRTDTMVKDVGPLQTVTVRSDAFDGPQSTNFTVGGTETVIATITVDLSPACGPQVGCPYAEIATKKLWWQPGTYTLALAPGTYTARASEEWIGGFSQITVKWRPVNIVKRKTGGGLRVSEIRAADAMGNVTVRKYRYTMQSDTARSSGVVSAEPDYDYFYSSPGCQYFSRSSMSRMPLGSGTPVGYREVTVWHGANGEYGKTRRAFRSAWNAADALPTNAAAWPFSTRTSAEWRRGQQTSSSEYNAAGQIQRRQASAYTFLSDPATNPETVRRFRGMSVNAFSAGKWGSVYVYNDFEVVSGWTYMDADTTVVYDESGASSFSTTRSYVYGSPAHVQLTEVTETNSDGRQRITRMKYPADYATGSGNVEAAALTAMRGAAHMHGAVVERRVTQRAGATDSVVQAEVTTFKQYAAGQYRPYQRFVLNSPSGITNFVASSVTGGSFAKDSRYLLQETADAYDAWGRVTQLTDARGKVTSYQYGGNANAAFLTKVTRVKDAGGAVDLVTDIGYDTDGFVSSIKDEGGSVRSFTYDLFGRLRQIRNHGGTVVKAYGYTYSRTSPGWTFNPNSPNAVVDTTFLQQTPTPKSVVSSELLDGLGKPIQTVAQDGTSYVVTATQYDAMGRPWRSWKPYTRAAAGYDASFAANATSFYNTYHATTQARPYTETQYTTDALARVRQVAPEFIGTTPTAFTVHAHGVDVTAKHQYTEVTDESGKKTRSFADIFGNEVKTVLGFGAAEATTTLFTADILGQRRRATDPRGLVTTYALDTRGLLTARMTPDAGTVSHKYDKEWNLRYTQDAKQASTGQVAFTSYDFAGRPLTSGVGAATWASLDPDAASPPALETTQGNWLVVRQHDAKPSTAAFPWSLFGAQIGPLTLSNVSGRLAAVASRSNGAWQATLFSYDADGRVAARYTYTQANGGGSVLAALNTTVIYVRDLRDALIERRLTVGSSTFTHWLDYDNRGLLWKLFASTGATRPATPDVTYSYRPGGELQDRQFQGGPLVPMRYTIREELEKIGDPAGTTYPFSARYAYHPNGTVAEAEFYSAGSPAAQKRYRYAFPAAAYDALNRLKSADFSSWSGSAWTTTLAYDLAGLTYDAAGNLTALQRYRETATLLDNLTFTYPAGSNRLSSVADAVGATAEAWDAEAGSFTYDANGNVLTAPAPYAITAVTYDHRNLPLSLTRSGTTTSYRYDDVGQRIAKQVGAGNTEVYVLDGAATLGVVTVNSSGTPVSWYFNVLAGDRVVGRQPNTGSRSYYHTDLLGSTRAAVQGTTIVESYDYEPWGLLMPGRTLGSGTKEGFTGKERDAESGLDYFGARLYMPALGRWTGVDPLAEKHPEWSPYNYVLNNPLVLIDPDGQQVSAQQAMQIFADVGRRTAPVKAVVEGVAEAAGMRDFVEGVDDLAQGNVVAGVVKVATSAPLPATRGGRLVRAAGELGDAAADVSKTARAVDGGAGATSRVVQTGGKIGGDAAQAGGRAAHDADFVVTPGGTAVPTSQSRMRKGLDAAGFPSRPTRSPGTEYDLPSGMRVRAMEPSGNAPRRASFENANGQPVTPDGAVPQPPRGMTPAARRDFVRQRTHVEQRP
jgi:RHS repeat-associated protein